MRVLHVVGARPNFMKIAPLMEALRRVDRVDQVLVHTGQHYDDRMSGAFFRDLGIGAPDVDLEVGSASHAVQTAGIMKAFEPVLQEARADIVVVVGDVNSTLACTLVAAKLLVPVAHVEAGLRSRDLTMPEEVNRLVTDRLADLLFTPSRDADDNLRAEGVPEARIHFVGNIMIDTLRAQLERARALDVARMHGVERGGYFLVTLHRPSNVDDRAQLAEILSALAALAQEAPVLFPAHPRTVERMREFGLEAAAGGTRVLEPVGYQEMVALTEGASLVLTDSGGLQEETTALGVPCLTLRSTTERPITIEQGTNTLVPRRDRASILAAAATGRQKVGRVPEGWDGHTADRIARILGEWHAARSGR